MRQPSSSASTHRRPNTKWSASDDAKLVELVKELGERNWTQIARQLPGNRMGKQCRERWRNQLDPTIRHDPFTEEEDEEVLNKVHTIGTRWARIAETMPGRTENAIKNRYYSNLIKRVDTSKIPPITHSTSTTSAAAKKNRKSSSKSSKSSKPTTALAPTITTTRPRRHIKKPHYFSVADNAQEEEDLDECCSEVGSADEEGQSEKAQLQQISKNTATATTATTEEDEEDYEERDGSSMVGCSDAESGNDTDASMSEVEDEGQEDKRRSAQLQLHDRTITSSPVHHHYHPKKIHHQPMPPMSASETSSLGKNKRRRKSVMHAFLPTPSNVFCSEVVDSLPDSQWSALLKRYGDSARATVREQWLRALSENNQSLPDHLQKPNKVDSLLVAAAMLEAANDDPEMAANNNNNNNSGVVNEMNAAAAAEAEQMLIGHADDRTAAVQVPSSPHHDVTHQSFPSVKNLELSKAHQQNEAWKLRTEGDEGDWTRFLNSRKIGY